MENFIEVLQTVVQNIVLPSVAVIMSYFGWKANSERNKLKAEIEGMRASNTEQEIKNQSSWIDLYEKLHDNQAKRIVELDAKVSELSKELNTFKNAFAKASSCPHFSVCPLRDQLSKSKSHNRKRTSGNNNSGRQHERSGRENIEDSNDSSDNSQTEPDTETN
jgi:hypothetical protein